MMVINNNLPALNAYDIVNNTSNQLQKSIQKLSTGLRINSAADDAAGLSISEKMRAQITGLDQAVRNTQDGISLIQTAEGALTETHSILQRMRELSVQAANDTYTAQDRSYIQEEVDQLVDEINHIGNTTTFNTKKLLNGDSAVLWSSSDNSTKAIVNGGLRTIDQFGQKSSAEGNYKITIKSTAGQGEVQKTDIFKLKHDVSPWYATVNSAFGIADASAQKAPEIEGGGTYIVSGKVLGATVQNATVTQTAHVGGNGAWANATPTLSANNTLADNIDLTLTVDSVDTENHRLTISYVGNKIGKDGQVTEEALKGTVTYTAAAANLGLQTAAEGGAVNLQFGTLTTALIDGFKEGEQFVYNINASSTATNTDDVLVTVSGTPETGQLLDHKYVIDKKLMSDNTAEFKVSYTEPDAKDPTSKTINQGSVYLTTNTDFADSVKDGDFVTYRKNVALPENEKPGWVASQLSTTNTAVTAANVENVPTGGYYTVDWGATAVPGATPGSATNLGTTKLNSADTAWTSSAANGTDSSGYLKLTVTVAAPDDDTDTATLSATFWGTKNDGTAIKGATGTVAISAAATPTKVSTSTGGTANLGEISLAAADIHNLKVGDSFYYKINSDGAIGDVSLTMAGAAADGTQMIQDPLSYKMGSAVTNVNLVSTFSTDGADIDYSKLDWSTNSKDFGVVSFNVSDIDHADIMGKRGLTMTWRADETEKIKTSIGEIASGSNELHDIDKFWDSQGNFLLEDPQTIRITQGDGQNTTITIYGHDTLDEVATKINDAIANDLGQGKYVDTEGKNKFATYVDKATEETSESVRGTMLIRSAVPGSGGTLTFSSNNEDLINALSLNTIQNASESSYRVTIEDAHTGNVVNDIKDEKITGNVLVGRLHKNVDVEFDALTGITAKWNEETKKFETISSNDEGEVTYLHLADNTTIFQIGANEGDDLGINIGDMRAHALGVDKVLVTDHDSASRSISIIDKAIDKVSTQRAKLGAYQNRLEHTAANLTTSAENLTAAESRIRDTDMAKTMMDFTKLQIMLQAGNSMLAQANQLPQNVLSLIR